MDAAETMSALCITHSDGQCQTHKPAMQCVFVSDFSDRLKKARARRYETATEAADAMRMSRATYLAHENGSRGGERSGVRYAQFFRVDYRWLLTGAGTMEGKPLDRLLDDLPSDSDRQEALTYIEYLKNRKKPA